MKRILPVLASLTLSGCWLLNGPGGFRSSGDAADGESAYPTADTDGAGDTGNEGADEGSTDEGSDHADASDPTADTAISPQGDPCQELEIISGTWYHLDGDGPMNVSLEEVGDTCAITTDGEGALAKGTVYGTDFPLMLEKEGTAYGLYFKGNLPPTIDDEGTVHLNKILVQMHKFPNEDVGVEGRYYR